MSARYAKSSESGMTRNAGRKRPRALGVGGNGDTVTPLGTDRLQGMGRASRLASKLANRGNEINKQPAASEIKFPCK